MPNTKAISNEEIIAALLQSGTVKEAAAMVGATPRTIYGRFSDREFRAEYRQMNAKLKEQGFITFRGRVNRRYYLKATGAGLESL